jgi:hypothetical protein
MFWFIIGSIFGTFFGVVLMCLFCKSKDVGAIEGWKI